MSNKALFLAWQDKAVSRQWFPIGRLDADVKHSKYRFRYTGGAQRARKEIDFPPLIEFPHLKKDYCSSVLFPLFRNRVIAPGRPDRVEYLQGLGLLEDADPVEVLSVNGGYRVTDFFEVFPKIKTRRDGSFRCRFFLQGWRHVNKAAQERIEKLKQDENLSVALDLTNPATGLVVQLQTEDYHMIGWAPRYLVDDLVKATAKTTVRHRAHVVQINPLSAQSRQRLLIEFKGYCGHDPMSGRDFKPLVP